MEMRFEEDGSLFIPENVKKDMDKSEKEVPSHIYMLKAIDELEFSVGRKLLAEILRGEKTSRVKKHRLDNLLSFASLELYDSRDIYDLMDKMIMNGLIEIKKLPQNRFMPVLSLTDKGRQELESPENEEIRTFSSCISKVSRITEEDREKFAALDSFLHSFNDEQKKAIIDTSKRILCIAGAGSGKTTVLTRKIEFLVKYRNVAPEKILAITFTRKARQEMRQRLSKLLPSVNNDSSAEVNIETFNSFCEKVLKKNEEAAYGRKYNVMDYAGKIRAVNSSLEEIGYSVEDALEEYFSSKKIRKEEKRDLYFTFVNDAFSLIDHYKYNEKPLSFLKDILRNSSADSQNKRAGMLMQRLAEQISDYKKSKGLRDYTDQLVHAIKLFSENKTLVPGYEHILVDEYQDVNDLQVKLLDILEPKNLFVVGDPRQSIYGWRGSRIEHILSFPEKHETCDVIQLTKNYRSSESIVSLGNSVIRSMELPALESVSAEETPITLLGHVGEEAESIFVAQSILSQDVPRKEIFVLARTNRQLENISMILERYSIRYLKRTVEEKKENLVPEEDQVTLSTVHAIKGLEAEVVYMIGVNSQMYPCIVSEHPFLNIVRLDDDYDKYAEELRLLYVGLTRAKKRLVVSYHNTLSKFVDAETLKLLKQVNNQASPAKKGAFKVKQGGLFSELRQWRYETSKRLGLKPYMIFSDRTLNDIVEKKPSSFYELQEVNGLGPNKIMKFGEEIMDMIRQF